MKPQDLSLQGKTALVTGAGRGIGFSIAQTLANFGARVLLVDKDEALLESACAGLNEEGADAISYTVDVTNSQSVAGLAEQVAAQYGSIDILVNNVGDHLNLIKPFLETTEEEWDAIYQINLKQVLSRAGGGRQYRFRDHRADDG